MNLLNSGFLLLGVLCTATVSQASPGEPNIWEDAVDLCAQWCCNTPDPSRIRSYSYDTKECVCGDLRGNVSTIYSARPFLPSTAGLRWKECEEDPVTSQLINKIKYENAVDVCAQSCCSISDASRILTYSYHTRECICADFWSDRITYKAPTFYPTTANPAWNETCQKVNSGRINHIKQENAADLCTRNCCNMPRDSVIRSYSHDEARCICESVYTRDITFNEKSSFPIAAALTQWTRTCGGDPSIPEETEMAWNNVVDFCAQRCCNTLEPSRIYSYSYETKECVCENIETRQITYNESSSFPILADSTWKTCEANAITTQLINKIKYENAVDVCAQRCCNIAHPSRIYSYSYYTRDCVCRSVERGSTRMHTIQQIFLPTRLTPTLRESCLEDSITTQIIHHTKHENAADLCARNCCNLPRTSVMRSYSHQEARCICESIYTHEVTFDETSFFPITAAVSQWEESCDVKPKLLGRPKEGLDRCTRYCEELDSADFTILHYAHGLDLCTCKSRVTGRISAMQNLSRAIYLH